MMRTWLRWLMSRWPGRIAIATLAGVWRLELFDRAMAIAAQLFTSVVPILIMLSAVFGPRLKGELGEAFALPDVTMQSISLPAGQSSSDSAFGVLGALFVLVSATSLSRALTRAMATVWQLPRPKSRMSNAWRWLAVVLTLVLSSVVLHTLTGLTKPLPPHDLWPWVVTFGLDVLLALYLPWLLLTRQVPARFMLPGAVLFAIVMTVLRPAVGVYLPRALEVSAERYGSMGVAFSYLAVMYVVAWVFLATQLLGAALVEDEGRLGALLRGPGQAAGEPPVS